MKHINSASDFLAAASLRKSIITIDGKQIQIQELSIEARDDFSEAYKQSPRMATAAVLAHGVIGHDGAPLLSKQQAEEVMASSGSFAKKVAEAILELSGLGDDTGKPGNAEG